MKLPSIYGELQRLNLPLDLFKTCYENGNTQIDMLKASNTIKEAYKEYYAWRQEYD